MLRAGGMPILFDGVYAPSTLGTLLREFSFGHARQLESVLREHLCALAGRTEVLAGIDEQAFIDIDSLLRPAYGHAKQGASYGHTKTAANKCCAKGLSPLATTISTQRSAPVIAGIQLRGGQDRLGQGRRADGRPGDRHRPRDRRHGGRSSCAVTPPTAAARWCALVPTRQGRVLPGPRPGTENWVVAPPTAVHSTCDDLILVRRPEQPAGRNDLRNAVPLLCRTSCVEIRVSAGSRSDVAQPPGTAPAPPRLGWAAGRCVSEVRSVLHPAMARGRAWCRRRRVAFPRRSPRLRAASLPGTP